MSTLPRRSIEPLSPPPEAFDKVVRAAHARRQRRGLLITSSVAVLAFLAGTAFATGSSVDVTQRIIAAAESFTNASPPAATPTATSQASPTRTALDKDSAPATAAAGGVATGVASSLPPDDLLNGRAVDTTGKPIAHLLVQPGKADSSTFVSSGLVAAVTDANGQFTIACPHAPVLLATWRLGSAVTATSVGGPWAATFVGASQTQPVAPACGPERATVTVAPGSSVSGTVEVAGTCPETTWPLWVWLGGDRRNTVRLSGLRDGATFRFDGLPAGTHTLGARGVTTSLALAAGETLAQDAAFTCSAVDSSAPPTNPAGTGPPTTTPATPTSTPPVTPSTQPSGGSTESSAPAASATTTKSAAAKP
ncbi:MAG: hypothetical protein ACXV2I_07690 [Actinomycetes bacterium]